MHALWMVLGTFLFASMAVCVKLASVHFNAAELVFYRGLIGMLLLWLLAKRKGISLATKHPGMHAWRSMVGVCSLGAWFYAIGSLSVATATTLNYMSSIWMAVFILAGSLLHWQPRSEGDRPPLNAGLILTILTGFAGVVIMLRPGFGENTNQFAAIAGLLSGMAAALAYMQVVVLARIGEPETRVVFYFGLGSAIAGGIAMLLMGASSLNHAASLWLLPMGVLAALGQLCMTHAYSTAAGPRNTLVVASLQYSGIVFAGLYSLFLFNDEMGFWGWVGIAMIICSGIVATVLRSR